MHGNVMGLYLSSASPVHSNHIDKIGVLGALRREVCHVVPIPGVRQSGDDFRDLGLGIGSGFSAIWHGRASV
jgi:hypothetical protein